MASYKNRVKELEQALAGIALLASPHCFPEGHEKDIPVCHKIMRITDAVLPPGNGTLADAKVTRTVRNLMTGKEIEIPLGTPLCCDPSSETYWSM